MTQQVAMVQPTTSEATTMLTTARRLDAEAERDAAIEEAAHAIVALEQARQALSNQKRDRCVCECARKANQVELQASSSTGPLHPDTVAECARIKVRNGTSSSSLSWQP